MEIIKENYDFVQNIISSFGISTTLIILFFCIFLYYYWKYTLKKIELIAQKNFERVFTEIKVKTHKRYERQMDVINNCYSKLQRINSFIKHLNNEQDFLPKIGRDNRVFYLRKLKNKFYEAYVSDKIVFSIKTCNKVDQLLPAIDSYINGYQKGLFVADNITLMEPRGYKIDHIWETNNYDNINYILKDAIKEMENEFKGLYEGN